MKRLGGDAWAIPALFGLFCAIVLIDQRLLGATTTEFWDTDAGSHYISGAMIRAWILAGLPSPLAFAADYNDHYRAVGIGLWGPAFYVIEGLWMLVWGVGRAATLGLTAALAAALATAVALVLARRGPLLVGIAAGLLLLHLPTVLATTTAVGVDLPVALSCLLTALALRHFIAVPGYRRAALVAALALFAVLIKGTALALAIFVPLALVLAGRARLIFGRPMLMAAGIIALVAGPWYLATYRLSAQGFRYAWGWTFVSEAVPANLAILVRGLGPAICVLGLIGAWRALRQRNETQTMMLALALATFVFQSIVPAALNMRYMLTAAAPIVALAGGGVLWLGGIAGGRARPAVLLAGLLAAATGLVVEPSPARLTPHGYIGAAAEADRLLPRGNPVVLAVGFDIDEQALTVEMAMRRRGIPDTYVVKASRLLGGGGYNNFDYAPKFATLAEARAALERLRCPVIVITRAGRAAEWKHVAQVWYIVHDPASGWRRADAGPPDSPVQIFVNPDFTTARPAIDVIRAINRPTRVSVP